MRLWQVTTGESAIVANNDWRERLSLTLSLETTVVTVPLVARLGVLHVVSMLICIRFPFLTTRACCEAYGNLKEAFLIIVMGS